jgi:prepilin-type processing-associated H-X9-DG protein
MPIRFQCPHCGVQTDVADQYVGQTGACVRCGKPITISGPGVVASATRPVAKGPSKLTVTLIVLAAALPVLLVVLAIVGVMVALILPATQAAREAARRAQCVNNLKQIGLAMHNYESANGCFPPAYVPDENGKPKHSWRVLILPYLDERGLYDRYDFDQPWDSPANQQLADLMPKVFRCPSDDSLGATSETSYVMVTGPGTVGDGAKAISLADIRDGLSNTVLVVELAGSGVNWLEPSDWDTSQSSFTVNEDTGADPQSNHPNVVNVLFGDGSVQTLNDWTDVEELRRLTTVNGQD